MFIGMTGIRYDSMVRISGGRELHALTGVAELFSFSSLLD